ILILLLFLLVSAHWRADSPPAVSPGFRPPSPAAVLVADTLARLGFRSRWIEEVQVRQLASKLRSRIDPNDLWKVVRPGDRGGFTVEVVVPERSRATGPR